MKTAVIYARYSSDNQTEQSIEGQLRVCQEYAQRNNILVLDTYIDRAMTGTNDHRPDFQRMLKDSACKKWNYVLVYKFDRFSRNKYEIAIYKKQLKDNSVKLLSVMENIPDAPEGILLESLIEGMAEYYSVELSQKVRRGMKETRLKKYFQGGTLPYGFKLDGRKIVVDEDKQEAVKYIFEQYAKGVYVSDIIDYLTNHGIYYKDKPFKKTTMYYMLRNEKYIGIYKHEQELITDMYPAIISTELFEKVREKIQKNATGSRSVKTNFQLRHKIICGYCGYPISAECGITRNGTKIDYYKCLGRKKHNNNCVKSTLRKDYLENFIGDIIIKELSKPKTLDVIVQKLMHIQNNGVDSNTTLKLLLKEQKQVQNSLNNIISAIEQGVVNKFTNSRMKDLDNRLEDLERLIAIEKSKSATIIPEDTVREYFTQALKTEQSKLINCLIKEIKLFNDKIEIQFNSPIYKSPDDNQGFSFCNKNVDYFQSNGKGKYQNIKLNIIMTI